MGAATVERPVPWGWGGVVLVGWELGEGMWWGEGRGERERKGGKEERERGGEGERGKKVHTTGPPTLPNVPWIFWPAASP